LKESLETPVVFLVFNRPRATRVVFDAIAEVRPAQLLIVADGPRPTRPGEADLCREVRTVVERIDWPCQVRTNFAVENLGCKERVISGLDWAFSLVEEAIILEDDCLPDATFFLFCQQLLARYRGDSRIAMISGNNFVEQDISVDSSYFFTRVAHIWGWATWRSAWQLYDRHLERWPEIKQTDLLMDIFGSRRLASHWSHIFDRMHANTGPNTWDYQWAYTIFVNNALSAAPQVNLVQNIGFGVDATHTIVADPNHSVAAKSIEFPLRHPVMMMPSRRLDRRDQMLSLPPLRPARAIRKLWRITTKAVGT
jgi:hypothetical protein